MSVAASSSMVPAKLGRTACSTQCPQCPFRPTAVRGWLGSYTVQSIFQSAWFNAVFLCHTKINYEDPRWEAKAKRNGTICRGYLAFANRIMAPKTVDDRAEFKGSEADQQLIIKLRSEVAGDASIQCMDAQTFGKHHTR